jgi:hypothetical protein
MRPSPKFALLLVAACAVSTGAMAHLDTEVHTHPQSISEWLLALLNGDNLVSALLLGGSPVLIGVAYGWLQRRRQRSTVERSDDAR